MRERRQVPLAELRHRAVAYPREHHRVVRGKLGPRLDDGVVVEQRRHAVHEALGAQPVPHDEITRLDRDRDGLGRGEQPRPPVDRRARPDRRRRAVDHHLQPEDHPAGAGALADVVERVQQRVLQVVEVLARHAHPGLKARAADLDHVYTAVAGPSVSVPEDCEVTRSVSVWSVVTTASASSTVAPGSTEALATDSSRVFSVANGLRSSRACATAATGNGAQRALAAAPSVRVAGAGDSDAAAHSTAPVLACTTSPAPAAPSLAGAGNSASFQPSLGAITVAASGLPEPGTPPSS